MLSQKHLEIHLEALRQLQETLRVRIDCQHGYQVGRLESKFRDVTNCITDCEVQLNKK